MNAMFFDPKLVIKAIDNYDRSVESIRADAIEQLAVRWSNSPPWWWRFFATPTATQIVDRATRKYERSASWRMLNKQRCEAVNLKLTLMTMRPYLVTVEQPWLLVAMSLTERA